MVKLTNLTALNVLALRETMAEAIDRGDIDLTATTATFNMPTRFAVSALDETMARLPTNGHPRHSLHAVRRKLAKAL